MSNSTKNAIQYLSVDVVTQVVQQSHGRRIFEASD